MRVEDAAALVPESFAARISTLEAEGGPSGSDWLTTLPHLIAEVLPEWELVVDGEPMTGHCALVLPVRGAERRERLANWLAEPRVRRRSSWAGRTRMPTGSTSPCGPGTGAAPCACCARTHAGRYSCSSA